MGNFLALGDRVASAKAEEGESRIKVLQEVCQMYFFFTFTLSFCAVWHI